MTDRFDLASALRVRLSGFDGRSPSVASEAIAALGEDPAFLDAVLSLIAEEDEGVSGAATWIVKDRMEAGVVLTQGQTDRLVDILPDVRAWQAQLHLCQSAGRLGLSERSAARMRDWAVDLLGSARPFLRAWSLGAACRLSADPSKIAALLSRMEADPAASVRARVRNLRKEFPAQG